MIWSRKTGKKMPGPANSLGLRTALAVMVAIVVQGIALPQAAARPSVRDRPDLLRIRLSGTYGLIQYDSFSYASNAETKFNSMPHLGGRAEAEKWFLRIWNPWPVFGVHGEAEKYPVQVFGRAIEYSSISASALWRVGSGRARKNWKKNEFVLSGGLNVQMFPDIRAYPGTKNYDLVKLGLFGVKLGARYGVMLDKQWRMTLSGQWILPIQDFRNASSDLNRQTTRSFGFGAQFDYGVSAYFDVGIGLLYQNNRLMYRPVESQFPQSIQWNNIAPVGSIQLWF